MKINLVIFGTGAFYKKRKHKFDTINTIHICAFIDNNMDLWGTKINEVYIYSPQDLINIQYDYIVLMSMYAADMYEKLINLGVDQCKILYWGAFNSYFSAKLRVYNATQKPSDIWKDKLLILTTDIDYNGGTIAAMYAAQCLQLRNYKVDVFAPDGNIKLIREMNESGIEVVLYDSLPYINKEEWIKKYRAVIVNVLQMIQCACEISLYKPVLWWLHEPGLMYKAIMREFCNYADKDRMQFINIYAVSRQAEENFNKYFPNRVNEIMCFGIPNMYNASRKTDKEDKIVFAIIGGVNEEKAQHIYLKAAKRIKSNIQTEFWIIGNINENAYGYQIMQEAEQNENIKIKGVLTRDEMYHIFPQIDVVVCASYEETMSIAIIEGMMFRKVCIVTDNTGIADYIEDGKNGFIVSAGDAEALYNRMQWLIVHRNQMNIIGDNAGRTYEKYFCMEAFGDRLENAITQTINKWGGGIPDGSTAITYFKG